MDKIKTNGAAESKAKSSVGMGGMKGVLSAQKFADTPKDKKQRLLQLGVSGFLYAVEKRNRLQDPKTPRNRWFRWKDKQVSK